VSEYNSGMQGVDQLDQLRARFSLADGHSFRRWHKKLAMAFIDIARVNAFICRKMSGWAPARDPHRHFMLDLIGELMNGSWQNAIGDTGLLYCDPGAELERPVATPSKVPPPTPTRLMECEAKSSSQVFNKSRVKRECVVCRFEGRPGTIKTVHCLSHKVSLFMSQHSTVVGEIEQASALESSQTCWQKFHEFYLPKGLFNSNGHIRRSCDLFKARKHPAINEDDATEEQVVQFMSWDSNQSAHPSVDYATSPHGHTSSSMSPSTNLPPSDQDYPRSARYEDEGRQAVV